MAAQPRPCPSPAACIILWQISRLKTGALCIRCELRPLCLPHLCLGLSWCASLSAKKPAAVRLSCLHTSIPRSRKRNALNGCTESLLHIAFVCLQVMLSSLAVTCKVVACRAALQMVLKCADIGHLAADSATHKRWSLKLEEEFFRQVTVTPRPSATAKSAHLTGLQPCLLMLRHTMSGHFSPHLSSPLAWS